MEKSYLSAKKLRSFLRDQTKPQLMLMILRMVLNQFYKVNFQLVLLKSTKIKRKSKLDQMMKSRELLEVLLRK